MKNYTARIAGVATLALALLPAIALSTAHAANSAVPYVAQSVRVSDLNLATASGKAALAQRADAAANHFCRDERNLYARAACQAAVRTEVAQKASGAIQYASRI